MSERDTVPAPDIPEDEYLGRCSICGEELTVEESEEGSGICFDCFAACQQ
jgi:hypothetical protein